MARLAQECGILWHDCALFRFTDGTVTSRQGHAVFLPGTPSTSGAPRPFLEHQSVDVAIIDVPWNGILEAVKIAAMAETYEINVAPHNFNGHLG